MDTLAFDGVVGCEIPDGAVGAMGKPVFAGGASCAGHMMGFLC